MVKAHARGRPGAAALPPTPSTATTAASSSGGGTGAARAKAAYQQYVKGKRREGLEGLEKAHEESPDAATCLVGAKLHVLEAAEAAFKVGAGRSGRLGRGPSSRAGAAAAWACIRVHNSGDTSLGTSRHIPSQATAGVIWLLASPRA